MVRRLLVILLFALCGPASASSFNAFGNNGIQFVGNSCSTALNALVALYASFNTAAKWSNCSVTSFTSAGQQFTFTWTQSGSSTQQTGTVVTLDSSPPSCSSSQYLDQSTNTCVSKPVQCPSGELLDQSTGSCVSPTNAAPGGSVVGVSALQGSSQYLVSCAARAPGQTSSVAPCIDVSGAHTEPVLTRTYLVDPDKQALFNAAVEPVSVATFSMMFLFSFGLVVTFWFTARGVGAVLELVRRG